jgi:DNA-binding FrmR family transcriptional regulator
MSQQTLIHQAKTRLRRIEGQVRGIQGMLDALTQNEDERRALRERVRQQLAAGKSQAAVARELGLSPKRVAAIARGEDEQATGGEVCERLLTQLLAVHAAIEQVGLIVMDLHLRRCVLGGLEIDERGARDLLRSLRLWARLMPTTAGTESPARRG